MKKQIPTAQGANQNSLFHYEPVWHVRLLVTFQNNSFPFVNLYIHFLQLDIWELGGTLVSWDVCLKSNSWEDRSELLKYQSKILTHCGSDEHSFTIDNSHLLGLEEARCSRWRVESPRTSRPSLLPTKSLFSLSFLSFSLLSLYEQNKILNWLFHCNNTLVGRSYTFSAEGKEMLPFPLHKSFCKHYRSTKSICGHHFKRRYYI